jgi:tetratricopeptide (TPR) repeat protein
MYKNKKYFIIITVLLFTTGLLFGQDDSKVQIDSLEQEMVKIIEIIKIAPEKRDSLQVLYDSLFEKTWKLKVNTQNISLLPEMDMVEYYQGSSEEMVFLRGNEYFKRGHYKLAIKMWKKLLSSSKFGKKVCKKIAGFYFSEKKNHLALKYYKKLLRDFGVYDASVDHVFKIGFRFTDDKGYKDAIGVFSYLLKESDKKDDIKRYRKALGALHDSFLWHGTFLINQNKFYKAKGLLKKSMADPGNFSLAGQLLIAGLTKKESYRQARQIFFLILKQGVSYLTPDMARDIAIGYCMEEKFEEARDMLVYMGIERGSKTGQQHIRNQSEILYQLLYGDKEDSHKTRLSKTRLVREKKHGLSFFGRSFGPYAAYRDSSSYSLHLPLKKTWVKTGSGGDFSKSWLSIGAGINIQSAKGAKYLMNASVIFFVGFKYLMPSNHTKNPLFVSFEYGANLNGDTEKYGRRLNYDGHNLRKIFPDNNIVGDEDLSKIIFNVQAGVNNSFFVEYSYIKSNPSKTFDNVRHDSSLSEYFSPIMPSVNLESLGEDYWGHGPVDISDFFGRVSSHKILFGIPLIKGGIEINNYEMSFERQLGWSTGRYEHRERGYDGTILFTRKEINLTTSVNVPLFWGIDINGHYRPRELSFKQKGGVKKVFYPQRNYWEDPVTEKWGIENKKILEKLSEAAQLGKQHYSVEVGKRLWNYRIFIGTRSFDFEPQNNIYYFGLQSVPK